MADIVSIPAAGHRPWTSEQPGLSDCEIGANTSGTNGPVPAEIAGQTWHWGAAGLAPFWLFRHNHKALAIGLLAASFLAPLVPHLGPWLVLLLCGIVTGVGIRLGFTGHRLAWSSRRFESVEQYCDVQRAWTQCSIILNLLCAAFLIFLLAIYLIAMHAINAC